MSYQSSKELAAHAKRQLEGALNAQKNQHAIPLAAHVKIINHRKIIIIIIDLEAENYLIY